LGKELKGFDLREDVFGVLMVKQIALFCVLHDHVNKFIFEQGVPEFDYVGVVHFQVQSDLTLDQFQFGLRWHFFQVDLDNRSITILRAYMRQVLRWRASLTVPNDPHPIFWSSMMLNSWIELNRCLGMTFIMRF